MEKEKRQSKYDYIRATAIMFVVLMHVCAHVTPEPYGIKWWGSSAVMLLTSSCNGLFFILSGKFNLITRNANDPVRFYKKRIVSIVLPFLICSFICFLIEKKFTRNTDNYITSLTSVFPTTHYWFVYELIGLMFWTPFFAVMMEHLDFKKKLIMTAVVLAFQTTFVLLKDFGNYPSYEFPLMGWPLFYLIGSFADDVPNIWRKRIVVLGVVCFIVSLLQKRILPDASNGLQDLSPKYFFSVLAIYYILGELPVPEYIGKAGQLLSKYSYYIYLFHNTVILLFFTEELGIYGYLIGRTGTVVFLLIVFFSSIFIAVILGAAIKMIVSKVYKKIG